MARTYPYSTDGGFKHDDDPLPAKELMLGHPTSPGLRDEHTPRGPLVDVDDGDPGIPRVHLQPNSHGPGAPGHYGHGAKEKRTTYADLPEGQG